MWMQYENLSIFRAPDDQKIAGFEIVEDFFRELSVSEGSLPVSFSNETLFLNKQGVFQALCLLIDFGELSAANEFIKQNPFILKVDFKVKGQENDTVYSPFLMLAPYLMTKSLPSDMTTELVDNIRPLFCNRGVKFDYGRKELLYSFELWLSLGLDLVKPKSYNTVMHSVIDLAFHYQIDSAYFDKIFMYTLSTPVYTGDFKQSLYINLFKYLEDLLEVAVKLPEGHSKSNSSYVYVTLLMNAYLKHGGHTIYDRNKVQNGQFEEIANSLSDYIRFGDATSYRQLLEIIFIIETKLDVFKSSVPLDKNSLILIMYLNDLNPMSALPLVTNTYQRDTLLSILKS